jgi:uncharacterized protein YbbC (DUF1343 family)
MRLCLESFLLIFLLSCQNTENLKAQTPLKSEGDAVNVQVNLDTLILGAERMDSIVNLLSNRKVGVVANQTSTIGSQHLVDSLLSRSVDVRKVFSPEHGFRGKADAGASVESGFDVKTGLPIISLYGSNKKPTDEQLKGLDVVLFDIQDVGARFYTYISTLHYVMEACAEKGIKVMVLDRPNPNGHYVDGPIRKEGFESFVGMHPIPIVHGMTVGEIAQMINGEKWLNNGIQCELEIISMLNYSRDTQYELPIAPSPNLRSTASINLYPSLCLFEGTVVSVGRGTDRPFEVFGHPAFANDTAFNYSFTPKPGAGAQHPKLEGEKCYGLDLGQQSVSESITELNLSWLIQSYQQYDGTDFFTKRERWFDLLAGTDELRKQIKAGKTEAEIRASWQEDLTVFKRKRAGYLLYP